MKTFFIFLFSFGVAAAFAQKQSETSATTAPAKTVAPAQPVKPAKAATPVKPAKQGGAKPQTEEVSFAVSGNCSMCKKRIENALYQVPGVKTAVWSAKSQQVKVIFQSGKTTLEAMQTAVAKAGHDTETAKAADATYSNLPGCCHYREGNGGH